jgi:hypothetical protein
MYLYFTSLWYLPDYCACAERYHRLVKQRYIYNNQDDIRLVQQRSKSTCTIISKISHTGAAKALVHQSLISSWLLSMGLYFTSLISSWLLYMYCCFTNLWYLPDYCTCTFASSVYKNFLVIVHVPFLLQFISSWLLYMYLCFPSLYLPVYCTCTFVSLVCTSTIIRMI